MKVWSEALAINDSYSVLHRNLGIVDWKVDHNPDKAITHYEQAVERNPNDLVLYQDLATLYIDPKVAQYGKAASLLEKARLKVKDNQFINALLCRAYVQLGENKKVLSIISTNSFAQYEGISGIYECYTTACIGEGEALFKKGNYADALKQFRASMNYPESLGPGPMDNPPAAESQYWSGLALEKMKKKDEAVKAWKASVQEGKRGGDRNRKFSEQAAEKLKGAI